MKRLIKNYDFSEMSAKLWRLFYSAKQNKNIVYAYLYHANNIFVMNMMKTVIYNILFAPTTEMK